MSIRLRGGCLYNIVSDPNQSPMEEARTCDATDGTIHQCVRQRPDVARPHRSRPVDGEDAIMERERKYIETYEILTRDTCNRAERYSRVSLQRQRRANKNVRSCGHGGVDACEAVTVFTDIAGRLCPLLHWSVEDGLRAIGRPSRRRL